MSARPHLGTALALLVAGVAAQFLWHAAPVDLQADAWNASTAALALVLIGFLALAYPARAVREVLALLAGWQIMTAGCSLAYIVSPFVVQEGDGQCSAALNLPLGAISGLLAILLAWRLYEWKDPHGR